MVAWSKGTRGCSAAIRHRVLYPAPTSLATSSRRLLHWPHGPPLYSSVIGPSALCHLPRPSASLSSAVRLLPRLLLLLRNRPHRPPPFAYALWPLCLLRCGSCHHFTTTLPWLNFPHGITTAEDSSKIFPPYFIWVQHRSFLYSWQYGRRTKPMAYVRIIRATPAFFKIGN